MCEDCIYYEDDNTYRGTGYCKLWDEFVNYTDSCDEYKEEE